MPATMEAPKAPPAQPAPKPAAIKSLQEIPDKIFDGPVSKKRPISDFVGGTAPKPVPTTPTAAQASPEPKPGEDQKTDAEAPQSGAFEDVPVIGARKSEKKADAPTDAEKPASSDQEKATPAPTEQKIEAPPAKTPGGQLREVLETTLSKNRELAKRVEELEQLTQDAKDAADLRKRVTELDERLKFVDYQSTSEFQDKFQRPLDQAIKSAVRTVARIKNKAEDRAGNADDILKLRQLYDHDIDGAIDAAEEMFGKASPEALAAVKAVSEANRNAAEALEAWRGDASKREQAAQTARMEYQGAARRAYEAHAKNLASLRPDLFDFSGDPELQRAFEDYTRKADEAFFPNDGAPDDVQVRRFASTRMLAAAAVPTALKLMKLQEENEQLRAQLKEFSSAAPEIKPTGGDQKPAGKARSSDALRSYIERTRA